MEGPVHMEGSILGRYRSRSRGFEGYLRRKCGFLPQALALAAEAARAGVQNNEIPLRKGRAWVEMTTTRTAQAVVGAMGRMRL